MSLSFRTSPPELKIDDSSEQPESYLHFPDLHLSFYHPPPSPAHTVTLLGHQYSRAMETHTRATRMGHALLSPYIPPPPLPSPTDTNTINSTATPTTTTPDIEELRRARKLAMESILGQVGLLSMGTFKPLWNPIHIIRLPPGSSPPNSNLVDFDSPKMKDLDVPVPQTRYGLPYMLMPGAPEWAPVVGVDVPLVVDREGARQSRGTRTPMVREARLVGKGTSAGGQDVYARLELERGDNNNGQVGPFLFTTPEFFRQLFMCESYESWQDVAARVREDEGLEGMKGPLEYVMLSGGLSNGAGWKTLVSGEMRSWVEYDSTKSPARNGLDRRVVSVGKMDGNGKGEGELAWVSVRFSKCLSRKVYKARGRLGEDQRSIVDDVLEYMLDCNPDCDMAMAGHDDIDRFMEKAAERPEYAGLITPTTTYADLSALLRTAIRIPVSRFHTRVVRSRSQMMLKLMLSTHGRMRSLFMKDHCIGYLPYVYELDIPWIPMT